MLKELKDKLIEEKVIRWSDKGQRYKRTSSWKSFISEESLSKINDLIPLYSSEIEFWYCLCYDIDINSQELICPVCKTNRRKFANKKYNTTCSGCSANANPQKIEKYKELLRAKPEEEKQLIYNKVKETQLSKYGSLGFNQWGKVKATKLEKYNDENYNNRDKCKETCLVKYGAKSNLVKYATNQTKESIEKGNKTRKNTVLEKYGVNSCFEIPGFNDKAQKTKKIKISKFESDNDCILQSTIIEKYGQGWKSIDNELEYIYDDNHHKYLTKESVQKVENYWLHIDGRPIQYRSNLEQEICDFLSEHDIPYIKNCRNVLINDNNRFYELDIYSEDYKIAIEVNGTYWHSDLFKDRYYHERKSKIAESQNIRLIHIYEHEWNNLKIRPILKSLILIAFNKLSSRIYARKCEIREISNKEAKVFNEQNHLQGHRNAQITYGLFYNNELVQLMSFSKTKYNKNLKEDNSWEIIRGCPGSNNIVVGGVSKLLKHFIKNNSPKNIFSYCDFNKFDGRSYEASGMKFIGYTGPDKKWVVNGQVINRSPKNYQQLKKSAQAVIWGSGSKKYLLTF